MPQSYCAQVSNKQWTLGKDILELMELISFPEIIAFYVDEQVHLGKKYTMQHESLIQGPEKNIATS